MKTVYLAGPITGCSYDGSVNWRETMIKNLKEFGINGLSPMRCKEYLLKEKSIADQYSQKVLSSAKGITTRDRWDVSRCDLVLVNLLGAYKVSIGTCIEYGWADAFRKPIITVIEENNIHKHAMLLEVSGFVVNSLEEGMSVALALLC